MRVHVWVIWFSSVLVFSTATANAGAAQQEKEKEALVKKCMEDWEQRRTRFESVRYVLSGTCDKKDLPAGSKVHPLRPIRFSVLFDLKKGRIRVEQYKSGLAATGDRYIARNMIFVFDGKAVQGNMDRQACELAPLDSDITIAKGSLHLIPLESELWPLLCAHGIVPTVNQPARLDRLQRRHSPDEFQVRGRVQHLERDCLVVRTNPAATSPALTDEFWIDTRKESAISRHIYFNGTNPWKRLDTLFQEVAGAWLPKSWVHSHTVDGQLIEVTRLTVENLRTNPPVADSDFTLPIPSGSIVTIITYPEAGLGLDMNTPANGSFRVNPDGKWVLLSETGFTTADGQQLPPESRELRRPWMAAFACLGVAVLATAVWCWRTTRRLVPRSRDHGR
jgi:hypothetical protein